MQDIRCEPARFLSVQTVQSEKQITKFSTFGGIVESNKSTIGNSRNKLLDLDFDPREPSEDSTKVDVVGLRFCAVRAITRFYSP